MVKLVPTLFQPVNYSLKVVLLIKGEFSSLIVISNMYVLYQKFNKMVFVC